MSRAPRRARHLGRHGPSSVPAPDTSLRGLVEEGIVTAAALNARDDLELAAASTQRLGALTSGMWRSLSRELATAAERLDRSTMERMDDIQRRAAVLQVDPDAVFRAGVAAMHLVEHRETLETLSQAEPDNGTRLLAGPDLLFGCGFDFGDDDHDDDDHEDDESSAVSVQVALFFWPTPLEPAVVTIAPSPLDSSAEPANVSLNLGVAVPPPLLDALAGATGLSTERAREALSALAIACWTAHQLDEEPDEDDEDGDGEGIDDDVEPDGRPDDR